jgi:hypothetical protein
VCANASRMLFTQAEYVTELKRLVRKLDDAPRKVRSAPLRNPARLPLPAMLKVALSATRGLPSPPCHPSHVALRTLTTRCTPPSPSLQVLLKEGADGFVEYLEEEKWKNAPEALRPRPKYYYYFEWMKDRIFEHYPELPEPVMDKLLGTDAAELDLLLQYPQAVKGQVSHCRFSLRTADRHPVAEAATRLLERSLQCPTDSPEPA